MKKGVFFWFIVFGFLLISVGAVSSTNGCGSIGDVECGANPVTNCDVTVDTVFEKGVYDIDFGVDICANGVVLDCNGATLVGSIVTTGVLLEDINGSTVKNCNIEGFQRGVSLQDSTGNFIIDNEVSLSFSSGIRVFSSEGNLISGNVVIDSIFAGVEVTAGGSNSILSNVVEENDDGILIRSSSDNNVLMDNEVNSNNDGIVITFNSTNNSVVGNTLNSNGEGIVLFSSSDNYFEGNTANFNAVRGIRVGFQSDSNTFKSNTITFNPVGINVDQTADGILVYDNYFANSLFNAADIVLNSWNVELDCSQTNIVGGPCVGGNFWHDYGGVDLDKDGIGDTDVPYDSNGHINLGGDFLPLVDVSGVCVGDTNSDSEVNVEDLINVILAWGTADENADVNEDGIVDVSDLVEVILNWGPCGAQEASWNGDIPPEAEKAIKDFDDRIYRDVERGLGTREEE